MKKIDMIVSAPHFYTMEGNGVGYLSDSAMAIDSAIIIAIGSREEIYSSYTAEKVIDKSNHVVLPGFIDAHMHTDIGLLRGLAQDTNHWMMYGLGPFSSVLETKDETLGGRLCYIEAIRAGTTTFGDFNENIEETCKFVDKIGVRACVAPEIRDAVYRIYEPDELYDFDESMGERLLNKNLDIYQKWDGGANERINVLFGPQGADFCSEKLLQKIKKYAVEKNSKIHMHVQQGDRETYQIIKRYGKRPIAWLDEIGYLDEHLLAVHLTDADDDEVKFVAKKGASMVACPGSIGIIDGIIPPSVTFQEAGGIVALGSDQAPGNNCHNIINEMKLIALFNKIKYKNPEIMPAWKALRMATIEGAHALGLEDKIGSLEVGKQADFIIIDLFKPTMMPVFTEPMRNIIPNLVYSARGDEICTVVVDGNIIYNDRKILTVDENQIKYEAQQCIAKIAKDAKEKFWKVNGTNAILMKENKL